MPTNVAPGNLGFTATFILKRFIVTHASIITSDFSKKSYNFSSSNYRTFRYPKIYFEKTCLLIYLLIFVAASVLLLDPYILGAKWLGLGAVTLSLKDGCFQAHLQVIVTTKLPFTLKANLGTLTYNLGCFPLD